MLVDIRSMHVTLGNTPILHDVSLSLGAGDIYGLLGPNGAGKTTTMAAALGLAPHDGGYTEVLGKDPWNESEDVHARVGVLPERNGFYRWMTAQDYLAFFSRLYGRSFSSADIAGRLSQVGLNPRPGQTIATFSRGMLQRLGLARALIPQPELLILDEPTNGLDPRGRKEIHDILRELASQGIGVLLCTHLLDDVDKLCTHIGVLVNGRTVAEGGLTDLLGDHAAAERYRIRLTGDEPPGEQLPREARIIGRDGDWRIVDIAPEARPEAVWLEFYARGWKILEIQREGGGLEALYLALTEGGAQ